MNCYLELGTLNCLAVARLTDHGPVLASSEGKEVLLPRRYATADMKVGDEVDVFVHTDSEDRIVATTERPKALLGEVAWMEAVDVTPHGAFVDWGLSKDLFVPRSLQREPMAKGGRYAVMVDYDDRTHRLVGNAKFDKKLARADAKSLKRNQAVELLIYARTDLGFKAVVERRYDGLLFHSEVFQKLQVGDTVTGYVKFVRPDGKVDLLSRPIGRAKEKLADDALLDYLRSHKGMMPLNYKSDPETIKSLLGLSKKAFKRSLTALQEKGMIEVKENGTFLRKRKRA
ncbi:S1-like domain-containing RNA-binding protein [Hydrogenimonas sp. SS33]|uniref:CvfB family protein n=1 Tax=Hydrogenimonas leucolamina TaxID=2954236 RepID=UPI00336BF8C4